MVFTITRFVPGGPVEKMILQAKTAGTEEGSKGESADGSDSELTEEQIADLKKKYGLDQSYLDWLKAFFQGDLGRSNRYNEPVWGIIVSKIPISLFFGLFSMFLIYAICIPLGVLKALKHNSFFDNSTSLIVFFGYAIPGYALGAVLLVFFAGKWELFPLGNLVSQGFAEMSTFEKVKDLLWHAVLPLCCYLVGAFAFMTTMVKNSLMENMAADYVRTALSKGVEYKSSIFKHALDNSLIPIATTFGGNLTVMIGGSFLIEKVFNIDGMGLLGLNSIQDRDYPVVMGILVISSLCQLFGNIISDFCVAMVDPRVKFD